MNPIKPQRIENAEAVFAESEAINESLVRVNFYNASKERIASRLVRIPSEEELTEENIWKAAGFEIITN